MFSRNELEVIGVLALAAIVSAFVWAYRRER